MARSRYPITLDSQLSGFRHQPVSTFNSANLNETQNEVTAFAVLSLQKHGDSGDLQISLFNRTSTLRFSPDWLGDLLFNGIAQAASRQDIATGIQADGSWKLNERHTLRAGVLTQIEQASANTTSSVLPVDSSGTPTTDQPLTIVSSQRSSGVLYGIYVQDEWRLAPTLTLNYGLRFDAVEEFTHESQVSPRVNLVTDRSGRHHAAHRLRALFCSATVRGSDSGESRPVRWYDGGAVGDAR